MLMFIVSISFAQYTPMTAAGYQFKRILCDSTLHIPSFCGIPTLRNSTAKNGAIAMDTCNYRFYMWTNIGGWSQIVGAGTDTTSLSNRIDQRVKYTDTAAMLTAYLRKQDTANKFVANVTKVNDSTIRVFKGNTITDLKILGKQVDTTSLSNRIDQKLGKADSTTYYTKYRSDTSRTNIYNAINTKLNKTDTTNKFVNAVTKVNDSTIRVWKGTTSTTIELPRGSGGGSGSVTNVGTGYGLSGGPITSTGTIIVDSATLSTKYLRRADTSNLVATKSNVALKLNIADTANKWVNNVTKINDTAIRVWKGTTSTVISLAKDVVYTQSPIMSKISNDSNIIYFNADTADVWRGGGGGGSQNLQQVTDLGNTTTNALIVDDALVHVTKLGFPDYGSNIIYPLRYTNLFQGALDIIDSLNTYPPTIYGYNNYSGVPSYKIGYNSVTNKPLIDFIGINTKLKITDEFISFSSNGSAITTLQPIPSGSSDIHYLPPNNGVDDTLLVQAPQDGQYYAQLNGGWASFTPGGGGGSGTVTSVATGYGLTGGPITNTGTISVDTATLNDLYGQNGRFGNDTATVVMAKVHNNSGVTLTNGKVVFLASSGTNSDAPSVRLANNKHDSTSANTFGFVSGSIANNDTGWVILSGKIEKLNTSAFANGDIIYLDSISGNWTKSKPIAPYHMVYLGVVVKANAGNGSIFVKCQNGYELDEIHDVQISGKLNNQVLAYSDTQKVWKNRNIYALVDTTPFQRKSISANTIMANNTASAANVTAQAFYDVAEQAMSNTITFGGVAPTTLTSANYSWSQIGKTVTVQFNAIYTTSGTSVTGLFFTLPSDMPAPLVPTGWTGASAYLYTGAAATYTTATGINGNVATSYIRRNAANTAFELGYVGTGVTARGFKFTLTYKAQ